MELRADQLQFAEALERRERIAALFFPREAAHLPAAVGAAFKREVESAHAQLGERTPRQQARVLRNQDFRIADHQCPCAGTDAQPVEPQQRAAPSPLGFDPVERDRTPGARAQP